MPDTLILTDAILAPTPSVAGQAYARPGIIIIEDKRIAYAGDAENMPAAYTSARTESLEGRLVTPGLIDCHTHLVYGGSRAREFEMRQNGETYEAIQRAGGGILSTVEATRTASESELLETALGRLDKMIANGVTTVEVKSGYGLDEETELRMLRTARALERLRSVRIRTTFLGAHAVPKGMDADEYLYKVCLPTLTKGTRAGLIDAVDGFCETVGFTPVQITRVLDTAKKLDLPIKLHAEQLSHQGGARLAAKYGALSADHLEHLTSDDAVYMAEAGTVAVLLPGAFYALRETQRPPVDALRRAGVKMALATDCNPGSSPMTSILLAMNMGAVLFGLTPRECLDAVTTHAADALGLTDCGRLAAGHQADLAIWDVTDPAELTYRIGDAPLAQRYFGGKPC